MKYYAGIGSTETPDHILSLMTNISSELEKLGYILRSGGARGADKAFEDGVTKLKRIYHGMPLKHYHDKRFNFHIDKFHPEYSSAYKSLNVHPRGFSLSPISKCLMIRNYFQIHGHNNEPLSSFVICWTKDGSNGYDKKTTYDTGGTGQAIRLAAKNNIPVYNLASDVFTNLNLNDIINLVTNGNVIEQETCSLF